MGFFGTSCFHFGQQGQATLKSRNQAGKGPMDPLQSWGCNLGARGCNEGIIPSYIFKFCGMYVICIEDDALIKGEGDAIPQLLTLRLMILHVTYVIFHYRLMIFYIIVELWSFAWLMWLRTYHYCLIKWLSTLSLLLMLMLLLEFLLSLNVVTID